MASTNEQLRALGITGEVYNTSSRSSVLFTSRGTSTKAFDRLLTNGNKITNVLQYHINPTGALGGKLVNNATNIYRANDYNSRRHPDSRIKQVPNYIEGPTRDSYTHIKLYGGTKTSMFSTSGAGGGNTQDFGEESEINLNYISPKLNNLERTFVKDYLSGNAKDQYHDKDIALYYQDYKTPGISTEEAKLINAAQKGDTINIGSATLSSNSIVGAALEAALARGAQVNIATTVDGSNTTTTARTLSHYSNLGATVFPTNVDGVILHANFLGIKYKNKPEVSLITSFRASAKAQSTYGETQTNLAIELHGAEASSINKYINSVLFKPGNGQAPSAVGIGNRLAELGNSNYLSALVNMSDAVNVLYTIQADISGDLLTRYYSANQQGLTGRARQIYLTQPIFTGEPVAEQLYYVTRGSAAPSYVKVLDTIRSSPTIYNAINGFVNQAVRPKDETAFGAFAFGFLGGQGGFFKGNENPILSILAAPARGIDNLFRTQRAPFNNGVYGALIAGSIGSITAGVIVRQRFNNNLGFIAGALIGGSIGAAMNQTPSNMFSTPGVKLMALNKANKGDLQDTNAPGPAESLIGNLFNSVQSVGLSALMYGIQSRIAPLVMDYIFQSSATTAALMNNISEDLSKMPPGTSNVSKFFRSIGVFGAKSVGLVNTIGNLNSIRRGIAIGNLGLYGSFARDLFGLDMLVQLNRPIGNATGNYTHGVEVYHKIGAENPGVLIRPGDDFRGKLDPILDKGYNIQLSTVSRDPEILRQYGRGIFRESSSSGLLGRVNKKVIAEALNTILDLNSRIHLKDGTFGLAHTTYGRAFGTVDQELTGDLNTRLNTDIESFIKTHHPTATVLEIAEIKRRIIFGNEVEINGNKVRAPTYQYLTEAGIDNIDRLFGYYRQGMNILGAIYVNPMIFALGNKPKDTSLTIKDLLAAIQEGTSNVFGLPLNLFDNDDKLKALFKSNNDEGPLKYFSSKGKAITQLFLQDASNKSISADLSTNLNTNDREVRSLRGFFGKESSALGEKIALLGAENKLALRGLAGLKLLGMTLPLTLVGLALGDQPGNSLTTATTMLFDQLQNGPSLYGSKLLGGLAKVGGINQDYFTGGVKPALGFSLNPFYLKRAGIATNPNGTPLMYSDGTYQYVDKGRDWKEDLQLTGQLSLEIGGGLLAYNAIKHGVGLATDLADLKAGGTRSLERIIGSRLNRLAGETVLPALALLTFGAVDTAVDSLVQKVSPYGVNYGMSFMLLSGVAGAGIGAVFNKDSGRIKAGAKGAVGGLLLGAVATMIAEFATTLGVDAIRGAAGLISGRPIDDAVMNNTVEGSLRNTYRYALSIGDMAGAIRARAEMQSMGFYIDNSNSRLSHSIATQLGTTPVAQNAISLNIDNSGAVIPTLSFQLPLLGFGVNLESPVKFAFRSNQQLLLARDPDQNYSKVYEGGLVLPQQLGMPNMLGMGLGAIAGIAAKGAFTRFGLPAIVPMALGGLIGGFGFNAYNSLTNKDKPKQGSLSIEYNSGNDLEKLMLGYTAIAPILVSSQLISGAFINTGIGLANSSTNELVQKAGGTLIGLGYKISTNPIVSAARMMGGHANNLVGGQWGLFNNTYGLINRDRGIPVIPLNDKLPGGKIPERSVTHLPAFLVKGIGKTVKYAAAYMLLSNMFDLNKTIPLGNGNTIPTLFSPTAALITGTYASLKYGPRLLPEGSIKEFANIIGGSRSRALTSMFAVIGATALYTLSAQTTNGIPTPRKSVAALNNIASIPFIGNPLAKITDFFYGVSRNASIQDRYTVIPTVFGGIRTGTNTNSLLTGDFGSPIVRKRGGAGLITSDITTALSSGSFSGLLYLGAAQNTTLTITGNQGSSFTKMGNYTLPRNSYVQMIFQGADLSYAYNLLPSGDKAQKQRALARFNVIKNAGPNPKNILKALNTQRPGFSQQDYRTSSPLFSSATLKAVHSELILAALKQRQFVTEYILKNPSEDITSYLDSLGVDKMLNGIGALSKQVILPVRGNFYWNRTAVGGPVGAGPTGHPYFIGGGEVDTSAQLTLQNFNYNSLQTVQNAAANDKALTIFNLGLISLSGLILAGPLLGNLFTNASRRTNIDRYVAEGGGQRSMINIGAYNTERGGNQLLAKVALSGAGDSNLGTLAYLGGLPIYHTDVIPGSYKTAYDNVSKNISELYVGDAQRKLNTIDRNNIASVKEFAELIHGKLTDLRNSMFTGSENITNELNARPDIVAKFDPHRDRNRLAKISELDKVLAGLRADIDSAVDPHRLLEKTLSRREPFRDVSAAGVFKLMGFEVDPGGNTLARMATWFGERIPGAKSIYDFIRPNKLTKAARAEDPLRLHTMSSAESDRILNGLGVKESERIKASIFTDVENQVAGKTALRIMGSTGAGVIGTLQNLAITSMFLDVGDSRRSMVYRENQATTALETTSLFLGTHMATQVLTTGGKAAYELATTGTMNRVGLVAMFANPEVSWLPGLFIAGATMFGPTVLDWMDHMGVPGIKGFKQGVGSNLERAANWADKGLNTNQSVGSTSLGFAALTALTIFTAGGGFIAAGVAGGVVAAANSLANKGTKATPAQQLANTLQAIQNIPGIGPNVIRPIWEKANDLFESTYQTLANQIRGGLQADPKSFWWGVAEGIVEGSSGRNLFEDRTKINSAQSMFLSGYYRGSPLFSVNNRDYKALGYDANYQKFLADTHEQEQSRLNTDTLISTRILHKTVLNGIAYSGDYQDEVFANRLMGGSQGRIFTKGSRAIDNLLMLSITSRAEDTQWVFGSVYNRAVERETIKNSGVAIGAMLLPTLGAMATLGGAGYIASRAAKRGRPPSSGGLTEPEAPKPNLPDPPNQGVLLEERPASQRRVLTQAEQTHDFLIWRNETAEGKIAYKNHGVHARGIYNKLYGVTGHQSSEAYVKPLMGNEAQHDYRLWLQTAEGKAATIEGKGSFDDYFDLFGFKGHQPKPSPQPVIQNKLNPEQYLESAKLAATRPSVQGPAKNPTTSPLSTPTAPLAAPISTPVAPVVNQLQPPSDVTTTPLTLETTPHTPITNRRSYTLGEHTQGLGGLVLGVGLVATAWSFREAQMTNFKDTDADTNLFISSAGVATQLLGGKAGVIGNTILGIGMIGLQAKVAAENQWKNQEANANVVGIGSNILGNLAGFTALSAVAEGLGGVAGIAAGVGATTGLAAAAVPIAIGAAILGGAALIGATAEWIGKGIYNNVTKPQPVSQVSKPVTVSNKYVNVAPVYKNPVSNNIQVDKTNTDYISVYHSNRSPVSTRVHLANTGSPPISDYVGMYHSNRSPISSKLSLPKPVPHIAEYVSKYSSSRSPISSKLPLTKVTSSPIIKYQSTRNPTSTRINLSNPISSFIDRPAHFNNLNPAEYVSKYVSNRSPISTKINQHKTNTLGSVSNTKHINTNPYYAVIAHVDDDRINSNLIDTRQLTSLNQLKETLVSIKHKANGQHVILDLDTHGIEGRGFAFTKTAHGKTTVSAMSAKYLNRQLYEAGFKKDDITVILETCNAYFSYNSSKSGFKATSKSDIEKAESRINSSKATATLLDTNKETPIEYKMYGRRSGNYEYLALAQYVGNVELQGPANRTEIVEVHGNYKGSVDTNYPLTFLNIHDQIIASINSNYIEQYPSGRSPVSTKHSKNIFQNIFEFFFGKPVAADTLKDPSNWLTNSQYTALTKTAGASKLEQRVNKSLPALNTKGTPLQSIQKKPNTLDYIQSATMNFFDQIKEDFNYILNRVGSGLNKIGNGIGHAISNSVDGIGKLFGKSSQTFDQQSPTLMANLMRDFSLTKEQAAGIVGNLGHESAGLQAGIHHIGSTSSNAGIGWAQWVGPRRKAFEQYLTMTNQKATDANANYGFLKQELMGQYRSAIKEVRKQSTVHNSMVVFEKIYEGAGIKNYASRERYANRALATLGSISTTATVSNNSEALFPIVGYSSLTAPVRGQFGTQRPGHVHQGTDYGIPVGTGLVAPLNATVSEAGSNSSMGTYIRLKALDNSGRAIKYTFMHLSQLDVHKGEQVVAGQEIGKSGNSGHSTGAHVHIEVQQGNLNIDPAAYFGKRAGVSKVAQVVPKGETKTSNSNQTQSAIDPYTGQYRGEVYDGNTLNSIKRYVPTGRGYKLDILNGSEVVVITDANNNTQHQHINLDMKPKVNMSVMSPTIVSPVKATPITPTKKNKVKTTIKVVVTPTCYKEEMISRGQIQLDTAKSPTPISHSAKAVIVVNKDGKANQVMHEERATELTMAQCGIPNFQYRA